MKKRLKTIVPVYMRPSLTTFPPHPKALPPIVEKRIPIKTKEKLSTDREVFLVLGFTVLFLAPVLCGFSSSSESPYDAE